MSDDLTTALRTMAESDQPPAMDLEHVLHQGRHSLIRRRMAAISGGTAAVAATALAVGVLAPAGSAGHRSSTAAEPASSSTTTPAAAVTSLPPDVNPHDPVTIGWKFGYLPSGMGAFGGGAGGLGKNQGGVVAYDSAGFALSLDSARQLTVDPHDKNGGPTEKIPATVPGARQAYWAGYGNGQIVNNVGSYGGFAGLTWQLPSGEWLTLTAMGVDHRADWKDQTLKAAAHMIRQDHSQPLPFRLTSALSKGLTVEGGSTSYLHGNELSEFLIQAGPDPSNAPIVMIVTFKTGSSKIEDAVPPQSKNTCADSNGLTVCVSSPDPEPAPLKAAGGAQALLNQVVSLGNDPANWTTDVLP